MRTSPTCEKALELCLSCFKEVHSFYKLKRVLVIEKIPSSDNNPQHDNILSEFLMMSRIESRALERTSSFDTSYKMVMKKTQQSTSFRRLSGTTRKGASSLSLGLNLDRLQVVLRSVVAKYTDDEDLASMAISECDAITHRSRQDRILRNDDLYNIMNVLEAFLSSSSTLPALVVFEVHSLIGLLSAEQKKYSSAIQSYMKALWMAASADNIPEEELAVTLHRLGKAYGELANHLEAKNLLEKALKVYEKVNVRKDHPCVVDARSAMAHYASKYRVSEASWCSLPFRRASQKLCSVDEERESHLGRRESL